MTSHVEWTADEKKAVCVAFYTDGESAGVIAKRFGRSRNAVIGVIHRNRVRYGFGMKGNASVKGAPVAAGERRKIRHHPPRPTVPREDWRPAKVPLAKKPPVPVMAPRNVTLLALKHGECRFAVTPHAAPADAHLFCGLPADGTYCDHHKRICHVV
jgi:hypothetical protein